MNKRRKEMECYREEFWHWEMDSVLGKQGKSKNTLLAQTGSRNEIIFKLPDQTRQ